MASSKRGGDINVFTSDMTKTGKRGSSSSPSRSGLSKNLTATEVKQAIVFADEMSTKGKKGSSKTPSSGNSARIIKGDV